MRRASPIRPPAEIYASLLDEGVYWSYELLTEPERAIPMA